MPLDRRLTITYTGPGHRNQFGEFVPAVPEVWNVWASVDPLRQRTIFEEGGASDDRRRHWRIRFLPGILAVQANLVTIFEGEHVDTADMANAPIIYRAYNIYEDTGRNMEVRRRWMVVEGGEIR